MLDREYSLSTPAINGPVESWIVGRACVYRPAHRIAQHIVDSQLKQENPPTNCCRLCCLLRVARAGRGGFMGGAALPQNTRQGANYSFKHVDRNDCRQQGER